VKNYRRHPSSQEDFPIDKIFTRPMATLTSGAKFQPLDEEIGNDTISHNLT